MQLFAFMDVMEIDQYCNTHRSENKSTVTQGRRIFGRPFVKRFVLSTIGRLSCLSCPVCLSVTLVYCGQTIGWIRMSLGVEIGLSRRHNMLDGDPAPPLGKGDSSAAPTFAIYRRCIRINRGPCLLWPNGWMDQDATWYKDRPRPRPHCVIIPFFEETI